MSRPSVDVVVPFAGSPAALREVIERFERVELATGDSLTLVDNRPADTPAVEHAAVVRAPERQSSYFARNRGAERGAGEWILFADADVIPPPDLVERYFPGEAGERAGVLAGAVEDEPLVHGARPSAAARYAVLRSWMTQGNTLGDGDWAYAQTANCAVRRVAFEAVGGFREHVRSGGDADLCFRLRAAGWAIEPRDGARVVHRNRTTLAAMLRQRARHGSGAAWLEREYPGSFPRRRWPGLAKWTVQSFARAPYRALRGRSDDALLDLVDPLEKWAFEVGRLFSNTTRLG